MSPNDILPEKPNAYSKFIRSQVDICFSAGQFGKRRAAHAIPIIGMAFRPRDSIGICIYIFFLLQHSPNASGVSLLVDP